MTADFDPALLADTILRLELDGHFWAARRIKELTVEVYRLRAGLDLEAIAERLSQENRCGHPDCMSRREQDALEMAAELQRTRAAIREAGQLAATIGRVRAVCSQWLQENENGHRTDEILSACADEIRAALDGPWWPKGVNDNPVSDAEVKVGLVVANETLQYEVESRDREISRLRAELAARDGHDREQRAATWDEGFLAGYQKVPSEVTSNPYRAEQASDE